MTSLRVVPRTPRGEPDLVHLIRQKLDAGLLPRQLSRTASRGDGDGRPCSACGITIQPTDVQYVLESNGGARRGGATFRLHVGCYAGWGAECRLQGWRGWRRRAA